MKANLLSTELPVSELGEGPYWDHEAGLLYWVDITGQAVHRYDPVQKKHEQCKTPSMIGFAVLESRDNLIAGLQDGVYKLNFLNGNVTRIAAPEEMPVYNRFNDGKCDRNGRLWCGTMNLNPDSSPPTGSLYKMDKGALIELEKEIFISNGLGWSPDNRTMYYTDTLRKVIWQYDYDIDSGSATNRRIFVEKEGPGLPDGLCVDSEGRVLTALWPGWGVEIHDSDGKLAGRVELPVPQVSSCAFGGKDLKTLFITTARVSLSPEDLKKAPLSGAVFAIEMDVPGLREKPCRLECK